MKRGRPTGNEIVAFDPDILDAIRARLKISDVVSSRFKLRKQGAEYVGVDDQSLTVNDQKGIYWDFAKEGRGGDIFDFLQKEEGYTFVGAVEALAEQAGIKIQHRPGGSPAAKQSDSGGAGRVGGSSEERVDSAPARGKRETVAEWDYRDKDGNLLYQVIRQHERLADGTFKLSKEGKVWKTFMQRRLSPDGDGSWILGLDVIDRESNAPLEFLKTPTSFAWMRATDERRKWKNVVVKTFESIGNVEHWLYNANAVVDEFDEPADEQRTVFMPEGEGKVDILSEWGLLAVTNSGGAKNFTADCAAFFAKAADVVLLIDNDRAGVERAARIAPMLLAAGTKRVRTLNFKDVWIDCPSKGDVKDWRDKGGGTRDALLEIVDSLDDWKPEPYQSRFGAKTFRDLGAPVQSYPWRIKHIVPMSDNLLAMGPSRSGKTFEVLDMAMHVHNGQDFAGKKVVQGGFVYLTYEGATGFENRLRAYLSHHGMKPEDLHSFAWLTRPPNIFASEDNVDALSEEVVKLAEGFRFPLAATIVDTHNSATRGSSEIKSDDLNKIMERYDIIQRKTAAPLWIIGHTNAEGKHRGNEQFFNNIETALLIERLTEGKDHAERRDDDGRVLRRVKVNKQREGDDRTSWNFVLKSVQLGTDEDGDPITSMVSVEPTQHIPDEVLNDNRKKDRPEGYYLNENQAAIFKALLKAIDTKGVKPPAELELGPNVRVTTNLDLGAEYRKGVAAHDGESPAAYANRTKSTLNRFRTAMMNVSVITVREAKNAAGEPTHFIWPTGRRVFGRGLQWPPLQPTRKSEPMRDQAEAIMAPPPDDDDLPPATVF